MPRPAPDASRPTSPTSAATRIAGPGVHEPFNIGSLVFLGLRARLLRGVSWSLIGTAFNQGSTFVVSVILANWWGLRTFGEYAIVQSTVAAVVYVAQMATGYTATKHLAEYRNTDPKRAGRLLGLCTTVAAVTGLAAAAFMFTIAPWLARIGFGEPSLLTPLMVAGAVVAPAVMNAFMMGALAGLEAYPALGKVGIVSGLFYVSACIIGGWSGGVSGAIAGMAISAVVQGFMLGRVLIAEVTRHDLRFQFSGMGLETDVLIKFALPASLSGFISLPAIWLANAILVSRGGGYDQMALFAAANSYRVAALVVPYQVNNVGLSVLNNQRGTGDGARYRRVYWANLMSVTMLVMLAALAVVVLGRWLLAAFGQQFNDGYQALVILMSATVLEMVAVATMQPLHSQNRIWSILLGIILPCYALLVLTAFALTPTHGAAGLSVAYSVGWGVAIISAVILVRRSGTWPETPISESS